MENEERLIKQIKTVYSEIVKRLIDPTFKFPEGGKVNRQLSQFIKEFSKTTCGEFSASRLADYCVFQIHKNRESAYQRRLAPNAFGKTAMSKYASMSTRQKTHCENQWLSEANLTRAYLVSLINIKKKEHPLSKYIYMVSEEGTKQRFLDTEMGFMICKTSTLMWSPFSDTCNRCKNADKCKEETAIKYPELYRIRLEKNG